MRDFKDLSKEELLAYVTDAAKNWLAHDGLWFQEVEKAYGIEKANEFNRNAWEKLTVIEAKRIMKSFGIESGGGLDALEQALRFRMYAVINVWKVERPDDKTLRYLMVDCRVQSARHRKNMTPHPCKPVGLVEYGDFAKTIDPRIKTSCLSCPPERTTEDYWCGWEFTITD
ncbi:DUF6125 family protein [Metallumcola ferriviriculae]|uniref:DUF6125 family protein n=1 Tax=Metallumcola ferriviriculae TaxID=3039180 RepID=A0AAU0USG5_9FIRM|nr:DUF6125 family protein [Desulfitibacteraceae bacterium MK1]